MWECSKCESLIQFNRDVCPFCGERKHKDCKTYIFKSKAYKQRYTDMEDKSNEVVCSEVRIGDVDDYNI